MQFELSAIFPIITTTLSFVFFLVVADQYRRKRKAHQLVWTISIFLFMITAGAEAFSILLGRWIPWVYRGYYVLAAVQVSFMGGGVIYMFDSRNTINERNTAKQFILFGSVWFLFSFLFVSRSLLFLPILLTSVIVLVTSMVYYIHRSFNKRRVENKILLCNFCRKEIDYSLKDDVKTCTLCQSGAIVEDYRGTGYTAIWHKNVTGRFFSNFFLIFSLFIFLLMNTLAWTAPLHEGLLVTGKEVSGLPWQMDPSNPLEARAIVRLFSPLHTVPGAIALTGGGIYSYVSWQLSIRKNTGHFEFATGRFNLWIAIGAYVLGQGALFSGFGYTLGSFVSFLPTSIAAIGLLYISEVISVSMMLWGFLGSDKLSKERLVGLLTLSAFAKNTTTS